MLAIMRPMAAVTIFDISTFKVQLPVQLDPSYQVDMNGVRFYAGQQWKSQQTGYSVGSDTPTYVLIGLTGPAFTPLLMAYGNVSLATNNGRINFDNYAGWTQGLRRGQDVPSFPHAPFLACGAVPSLRSG
jgi:hypothetical protein